MESKSLEVKNELLYQIELYLNNKITRKTFGEIAETYYTKNAHLIESTDFYKIYSAEIPDLCLIYIDEPGNEDVKEKRFRSGMLKAFETLKKLQ